MAEQRDSSKPVVELGTDIKWQIYPSKQYRGMYEVRAFDPDGQEYYPVDTPCGRICLRKMREKVGED